MIRMCSIFIATLFLGVVAVQASPALSAKQSITALTTVQVDYFNPYTFYAGASYCTPSQTFAWNCGTNCQANPGFKTVASGGDGNSVQYWYVGYDANLDTVIVSHQGTNFEELLPILTDVDFFLINLDSTLFPGITSDIEVHNGFAHAQANTALDVLAAVQKTMETYSTTKVTMVGHSLGAAISLLDSVYLPLWLPQGTIFETINYGLPRVGNQAFANYVDANLHLTHINNKEDPVPTVPGMSWGFVHPSGEVHIEDSGVWAACPGQDNPSARCIVGDLPEIWNANFDDHYGPYNGIMIGCST